MQILTSRVDPYFFLRPIEPALTIHPIDLILSKNMSQPDNGPDLETNHATAKSDYMSSLRSYLKSCYGTLETPGHSSLTSKPATRFFVI